MSKMPAKKKSCFQITSVTQAQVAAVGAADDTESLEDPDESRTEDVSSEIYDMSRADYEPTCDRSSSEEGLNNVGEPEAPHSVMAPPHIPQPGQLSGNPKGGVSGAAQTQGIGLTSGLPLTSQPSQTGAVTASPQPAAASSGAAPPAPATSTVSCTSRFRVIKLDHGTGEPFRRGRWTCTEFYEKDSESSAVSRTVESIRHVPDPAQDRDSGIGLTGGSAATPATLSGQGLGSVADASLSSSRMDAQQILHQNYSTRQPGVSSSASQSSFSGSKPATIPTQPALGGLQPSVPQNVLPVGLNGLPQSGAHIQKSPLMPPSAQPVPYPPLSHHLSSQTSGLLQNQTEYYQQQQQPLLNPVHSIPVSAGLSSVGTSVPSQVGDAAGGGGGGGSVPVGQPPSGLLQQQQTGGMGAVGGSILVSGSTLQQTGIQFPASGQPQTLGLHSASSGVQNVPAVAASSSVPTTVPASVPSASSAAMPNVTTSSLLPGQIPLSKTPLGLGAQGLPVAGLGHVEGSAGGGKLEGLINAQSPVVSGKDAAKPLMPESLQLATPTVNSLFGIHIPVDGEMDRNPSKAFYQAFQSGSRLRDSKAHSDRASGTNVAAIDNKIEQAMDLVKSHLMYAVREEVEVLKEQIKELYERNSVLERENAVLKSLANNEQLSQLSSQSAATGGSSTTPPQQPPPQAQPTLQAQPPPQPQSHPQLQHHPKPQQLQTQPQLDPGQQQQLQPNVTSA